MPLGPQLELPSAVRASLPPDCVFELAPPGETSFVVFAEGDDCHRVIKCSRGPVYDDLLEREYVVLRALHGTTLPIPATVSFERQGPVAWLVTERLPGEPLWEIRRDHPDHPDRVRWMHQVGRLLARIHGTPIPAGFPDGSATPWREPSRRRRARAIGDDELESVLSGALEREDDDAAPVRTLVHGDFTLDNILVGPDGVTGVIDWGAAGPGDPAFDLALALSTAPHSHHDPEEIAAFLKGYRTGGLSTKLSRYVGTLYAG